ncbi:hypothetical protein [Streptomyces sp. NPDC017520]|uniref:hypothetical protein n=1 Tax=Streptomyces sp. NPDC017520 TaxID=3364998 RepID=UPI0037AA3CD5
MTVQPDLIDASVHLARVVAAGRATREEAEQLVHHGATIAARASAMRGGQRHSSDDDAPAAIKLRNAAGGGGGTVATAGEIRAALAERPMAAHDYLRSLSLATLPAWPLPDDDATVVVVYRGGASGFGGLWEAIGSGDETEIARAVSKARDLVLGPSIVTPKGLGD